MKECVSVRSGFIWLRIGTSESLVNNPGNFLTRLVNISFSRRIQLYEANKLVKINLFDNSFLHPRMCKCGNVSIIPIEVYRRSR